VTHNCCTIRPITNFPSFGRKNARRAADLLSSRVVQRHKLYYLRLFMIYWVPLRINLTGVSLKTFSWNDELYWSIHRVEICHCQGFPVPRSSNRFFQRTSSVVIVCRPNALMLNIVLPIRLLASSAANFASNMFLVLSKPCFVVNRVLHRLPKWGQWLRYLTPDWLTNNYKILTFGHSGAQP